MRTKDLFYFLISFCVVGCGWSLYYPPDRPANANPNATPVRALSITASASTIRAGGTVQLTATGGTAPYKFSLLSGSGGRVSETNGIFVSSSAGTHVIRVTDANQTYTDITLVVTPQ